MAIFAERAGEETCWHPDCFCCSECGELLEDLLYYYSQGQLYCGRHFAAKMNIPRCSACDELIFSAEFTQAEERFWHVKHFCCWICDLPLAGHQYIGVEGMPHCLQCWQAQHGKTCLSCNLVIHPKVTNRGRGFLKEVLMGLLEDILHLNTLLFRTSACLWVIRTGTLDLSVSSAGCVATV